MSYNDYWYPPNIPYVWRGLMANPQKSKSSLGETLATKGCGLSVANGLMYGKLPTNKTITHILATDWCGSFFPDKSLDNLDIGPLAIKDVIGERKTYFGIQP